LSGGNKASRGIKGGLLLSRKKNKKEFGQFKNNPPSPLVRGDKKGPLIKSETKKVPLISKPAKASITTY
jgi:hypothetical protein